MGRFFSYQVPEERDGQRLDTFLRGQGYSQRLITKLKRGGVLVNGSHRRMVDPVLRGDLVEITLGGEDKAKLIPNPSLRVEILYEDADYVLFNKPAGIPVHPSALCYDDALGNLFAARYPGVTFRPLNRLDRDTTGLCLAAKNTLAASLAKGKIEKAYFAIVQGILPEDSGTIDAPLIRVAGSIISRRVHPDGQPSVTHYQVLGRGDGHTFVRVLLETGRTHQIRVHFSYIGFPLAGDSLYGGSQERIKRQALHCGSLSFWTVLGEKKSFSAPLPEDMAKFAADFTGKFPEMGR